MFILNVRKVGQCLQNWCLHMNDSDWDLYSQKPYFLNSEYETGSTHNETTYYRRYVSTKEPEFLKFYTVWLKSGCNLGFMIFMLVTSKYSLKLQKYLFLRTYGREQWLVFTCEKCMLQHGWKSSSQVYWNLSHEENISGRRGFP